MNKVGLILPVDETQEDLSGRADRDDYVTINWNNVEAGLQGGIDFVSFLS